MVKWDLERISSQAISSNAVCDCDIVAHLVGPLAKWPKIWLPTNVHNFMSNFGSQQEERAGAEWRIGGSEEGKQLAWPRTMLLAKCSDKSDCHFCIFAPTDDPISLETELHACESRLLMRSCTAGSITK